MQSREINQVRRSDNPSENTPPPPQVGGALDRLAGGSPNPADRNDLVDSILTENLSHLDRAAGIGFQDGIFSSKDLAAVVQDPKTSPELRWAAQQVLDDPNLYHSLDAAHGHDLDDKISLHDLQTMHQQHTSSDAPGVKEMAEELNQKNGDLTHFKILGHATIDSNGQTSWSLSKADLERAVSNPNLTESERQLAQHLLENPNAWNALDLGGSHSKSDEISQTDLNNVIESPDRLLPGDMWTKDKDRALATALNDPNLGDGDLFRGFRQTNKGNCVSTAIIKAAMDHYDNQIFDDVRQTADGGYSVKLQDGSQVNLTREELAQASAGDAYQDSSPEAGAYANLIYAVMAKRAQQMGHQGSRTFGEALTSLANGESPQDTVNFIGLEQRAKQLDISQVQGQDGVVAWGNGHCVYVDTLDGQTYSDAWGRQTSYDGTNNLGKPLTGAFIFT
ncbi:MAG: HrpF/NolX family T3SS translocon protein [Vulcanimicrobiota bacterium]